MKLRFLILSLCLTISVVAYSQLDKPLRAEINVPSGTYPFTLINLENKGVLVHTATSDVNRNSQNSSIQDFLFYDVFLRQTWQIKTRFPVEYAVVGHTLEAEQLHIILRNQVYRNTHTPTFLMNVNLLNGEFTIDTLFSLAKVPTFVGFVHNSRVWLVQVDRSECSVNTAKIGDSIIFKYDFPKFSSQELVDAALDTISQKLYVLYGDDSRRNNFFTLTVFDTSANLLMSKEVRLNDENRPIHAKLHLDTNGKLFIYGTYNLTSERQRIETMDRVTASAGFFSMGFDGSSMRLLSMQNYVDFDSVDARISPDQSQVLRQKRHRRQHPFSLEALVPIQLKTIGDNLLMVGESVTREFRTTTRTYYDYYGRVIPYTTTIFDGYRFNDAFIWHLDSNGNAYRNYVSDISMALNSKTLLNKVALAVNKNETVILFANATNVFYKSLRPHEDSHHTLRLQPLHKSDRIVEDYDSRILNWYDSHFLVCGYQTIQNNTLQGANRRVVFYLSKVSLD
ncbi:MAG: hypothetical protein LBH22_03535 [Bacteroidales bacterium]|jgi:hypothetical protein|nr:hypothetical protein [Bacteroidales bacterium]